MATYLLSHKSSQYNEKYKRDTTEELGKNLEDMVSYGLLHMNTPMKNYIH